MSTVSILLALAALGSSDPGEEFYQDFTGSKLTGSILQTVGNDPKHCILREPRGLRLVLPAKEQVASQTGFRPRFRLCGDFEVTVTYEFLKIEPPKEGQGPGLMLWIDGGPGVGTASVAHRLRPQEGMAYTVDRATRGEGGKLEHQGRAIANKTTSGQLSLRRTGEELYYLAAGPNMSLQEIYKAPFGKGDLTGLRVVADPGGSRSALEVRLTEARFRAGELRMGGPREEKRRTPWLVGGAVLVTAAGGFGVWRYRRSRTIA